MNIMRKCLEEFNEAIFPSNIYCVLCGSMIDRSRPYALCDDCITKIHWITGKTCIKCGKALPETYRGIVTKEGGHLCYDCIERTHNFTRGWSCMTYGLYEREIMMDIKYHNKGYMAYKMGDVLFDRMECLIKEAVKIKIVPFDVVIPIPISKRRLLKRGYNQSEFMAKQFLKRWKASEYATVAPKLESKILLRKKETTMLRSLNPTERKMVLRDAFEVKKEAVHRIEGKTILLIDDIYTTGATADSCSKTLKDAGSGEVYILTLCSGGNRMPR